MTETRWIVEGKIDPRWPINTRGNVGEVFPEVITTLSYELGIIPGERAWRRACQEMGVSASSDFASDEPVIIGMYGGYCYLNLSYLRIMGVRAPGSSADAVDVSFFGEGNPPPYTPKKGDKNLGASLRILKTVLGALNTTSLPAFVDTSFAVAADFEMRRPALDAPDGELLAYLDSFAEPFEVAFGNHMVSSGLAGIVSGILAEACEAAGEPGLVTHLIGAAGDVRSAQYSNRLYELARMVRADDSLRQAFSVGVDGLAARLGELDGPAAAGFNEGFARFIADHGHRGPNDWELSSRTWDNTPELALSAIDSMRRSDHDLSPSTRLGEDQATRDAAIAKVRPHVKGLDRLNFDKAVRAIPFWSQAREATRDRAVRVIWPAKQVYRELVRRGAERGGDPNPVHVALLSPSAELPAYLNDPSAFTDTIAQRAALYDRYSACTPPFFITSQADVPTLEQLEADQGPASESAAAGDVLNGNAGSAGTAEGVVRVILDPQDATDLEPGEVLVAPLTDPSWTPLFLPAAAVVVNVGALMSHAVIVARELGIPCVVAVEDATEKLATGMTVKVDGAAGTVAVVAT